MAGKRKQKAAERRLRPTCPACAMKARLTTRAEAAPNSHPRYAGLPVYLCDGCGAYVGCHPGTFVPLGVPADAETRRARSLLHDKKLDPLWLPATLYGDVDRQDLAQARRAQRKRVYAFLAYAMDIEPDQCHTALFSVEDCRRAWRALCTQSAATISTMQFLNVKRGEF